MKKYLIPLSIAIFCILTSLSECQDPTYFEDVVVHTDLDDTTYSTTFLETSYHFGGYPSKIKKKDCQYSYTFCTDLYCGEREISIYINIPFNNQLEENKDYKLSGTDTYIVYFFTTGTEKVDDATITYIKQKRYYADDGYIKFIKVEPHSKYVRLWADFDFMAVCHETGEIIHVANGRFENIKTKKDYENN